ncbi:MAG: MFS transporter [Candidatus Omnitrophota bacterium]|jgi:MFS family permease|nr:MAG: MFS transporter [Candidatus Omnitrophota bacterium]
MEHRTRLFLASCIGLVTTAMILVIRGDIAGQVEGVFQLTHEQYGFISSMAFYGVASSVLVASPLLDIFGMRNLLYAGFVCHVGGILAFILAPSYPVLYLSMLVAGFGNGLVEVVINPLCATVYAEEKTRRLNILHAWWPGGLIIGGILSVCMGKLGWEWQTQMGIVLIPTIIYGILIFGQKFPVTERVEAGVSYTEMVREVIRPGFLLLLGCMMLTAATEVAPSQWVGSVLSNTANMSGTMVFVYGSAIMFVLRFFAGPLAKKISPIGMMWGSVLLSAIGLYLLSGVTSAGSAYLVATIFYVGVCFMWPTMLGITSERYPKGGALLLGLIVFIGNFSIGTIVYKMGSVYDVWGPAAAFRFVAILPCILFVVFGIWWIRDFMTGGYKTVRLTKENHSHH